VPPVILNGNDCPRTEVEILQTRPWRIHPIA
jgi:hypothetical protein